MELRTIRTPSFVKDLRAAPPVSFRFTSVETDRKLNQSLSVVPVHYRSHLMTLSNNSPWFHYTQTNHFPREQHLVTMAIKKTFNRQKPWAEPGSVVDGYLPRPVSYNSNNTVYNYRVSVDVFTGMFHHVPFCSSSELLNSMFIRFR